SQTKKAKIYGAHRTNGNKYLIYPLTTGPTIKDSNNEKTGTINIIVPSVFFLSAMANTKRRTTTYKDTLFNILTIGNLFASKLKFFFIYCNFLIFSFSTRPRSR